VAARPPVPLWGARSRSTPPLTAAGRRQPVVSVPSKPRPHRTRPASAHAHDHTPAMAFFSALELILFVFMLGLVLAISVPLSGALVRFRASYNPRGLALDAEGGATPYTGPVVNSYFGMIKRVYAIEVRVLVVCLRVNAHAWWCRACLVCTRESVSERAGL
jgi:hypothetical protein